MGQPGQIVGTLAGGTCHSAPFPDGNELVPIKKSDNLVEIKARGKFNRRHMVDIPRIKFFVQRRYRAN
jgi:hypothetical protein